MRTLSPLVIARSPCDEAIQTASTEAFLDCFAEPVIGPRFARTRWLAMTELHLSFRHPEVAASSAALEGRRPGSFILRGAQGRAPQDDESNSMHTN